MEKWLRKINLKLATPLWKWAKIHCIRFVPFKREVANFKFMFLSHLFTNFERLGAYPAAYKLNFRKHTNFFLSDEFQRSYGHVNKDHPFFGSPCMYLCFHFTSCIECRICGGVKCGYWRHRHGAATLGLNGAIYTKLLYKLCRIFYNGDM